MRRLRGELIPKKCVGPPTTSRSTWPRAGPASITGLQSTTAPGAAARRPSATASATSRVRPNKLSYTTVARITGHYIP